MKRLLIVLLALTVSISGCSKTGDMNKTGYECPTCEGEVAETANACVHCGQGFIFLGIEPIALDPEVRKKRQKTRDMIRQAQKEVDAMKAANE